MKFKELTKGEQKLWEDHARAISAWVNSEDKAFEYLGSTGKWRATISPVINNMSVGVVPFDRYFRIKPEPKYRPWTGEEGVGKTVITKTGGYRQIVGYQDWDFQLLNPGGVYLVSPGSLLHCGYTQLDGSPCGVLEGEG